MTQVRVEEKSKSSEMDKIFIAESRPRFEEALARMSKADNAKIDKGEIDDSVMQDSFGSWYEWD
ncbi:hypothetical protein ACMG4M_05860 [Alcanivorax sp. IL3]|uniref:hypothetical protein n=1 Tax=unclassified Alcanivorax TaxID=2638842 RepID=UPI0039C14527